MSGFVGFANLKENVSVIENIDGKEPMAETTSFGEYVICHNGKIYNTKELRKTLEENGFTFNSYSDDEILLKSYIFYGNDVVKHLNGMYGFVIWNSRKARTFFGT